MNHAAFYLDIVARGRPQPAAAAEVIRVLHQAFVFVPGTYAIALPDADPFKRIRIFAETATVLHDLHAHLQDEPAIHQFGYFRAVAAVPQPFDGKWVSYRRYRIPTRKAERNPGGTVRVRRILQADALRLPFFDMRSKSTGQNFRLYIQPCPAEPNASALLPDGYGLASATRPFALPVLP